ncbi:L-dopachrome tautomerase-related protein [Flammeovirga sp. OC4]|uniref:L-dopachrome tautomerase-related protein n=1 Tax=Flammeovirga sp. OC4 TaxID=1382345 RepID=UPI000693E73F|nr:L-dopachrome tautomerase-related protein [Flammeovirga sp. OC4]
MNIKPFLNLIFCFCLLLGCQKAEKTSNQDPLTLIAQSAEQWTGIAVSKNNRVFVNYPTWTDSITYSVAEIKDGKAYPYPSEMWNTKIGDFSFYAVQSVVCDSKNRLWVLDTSNKQFKGVIEGGPVLYVFDLSTDELIRSYNFPKENYFKNSYYNDVRIDIENDVAYITDSGIGGIILLDLKSGSSKRFLTGHKSVQSELDHLICDGLKWENSVASDGIALSPDFSELYFIALTSHTLYKIKTAVLLDENASEVDVQNAVQKVANIPATDGMLFDRKGNLWLGGLETNGVNVLTKEGKLIHLLKDKRIRWADSFAKNLEREIFFTTSQIHLPEEKRGKYEVYKVSMSLLDEMTH